MKIFISQPMNGKTDEEILKVRKDIIKKLNIYLMDKKIDLISQPIFYIILETFIMYIAVILKK